jgi:hypothetical protein
VRRSRTTSPSLSETGRFTSPVASDPEVGAERARELSGDREDDVTPGPHVGEAVLVLRDLVADAVDDVERVAHVPHLLGEGDAHGAGSDTR